MKLIILDRDGVINKESRAYIKNPEEWIPIPGSIEAIAKLTKAGYTINIATNQSAVARGLIDLNMLEVIHAKLLAAVAEAGGTINEIYFCPHGPDDGCNCRKPKTGMLDQMEADLNTKLTDANAIYIGDSYRDLELAFAKGCAFILITGQYGDGQETLHKLNPEQRSKINTAENLAAAAETILCAKPSFICL